MKNMFMKHFIHLTQDSNFWSSNSEQETIMIISMCKIEFSRLYCYAILLCLDL